MGFNYYKFCSARSPDESLMKFDDLQRCPNEAQNLDISYVGWKVATLCKIFMCTVHTVHAWNHDIYIYILTTDHPPIDCFPPSHFTDNCGTEVPWHQGRWSLHGALAILTHQNSVGDFSRPTEATIPEKMEKAKKIAPIQSIPWTGASIRHCEFPKMVAFESWAHKSLKNPSLIYAYICFVSRHSLFNSKPKLPWICRYLTCQSFLFKRD